MSLDAATQRQNQAAEPGASTWLSANAGSGKTRVLTDRVARLLLDEVPPQNILCLTYTKAAASEMQNRLFRRLGGWSMADDIDLTQELGQLGIAGLEDRSQLAKARRLFARAIETPGGLRIQTIHSFCASLLRRFPLEAGVSPHFTEMDDRAAGLLREEIVEELADGGDVAAVDAIAAEYTGDDLGKLTAAVVKHRETLARAAGWDEICGWFDLAPDTTEADVLALAFNGEEPGVMAALLPVLAESEKVTDRRAAEWLGALDLRHPDLDTLDALAKTLLTGAGTKAPFTAKLGSFPTKDARAALGAANAPLETLMQRVEAARELQSRLCSARKSAALHRFAAAFLPAYEARKQRLGWLDFDDLILKTRALLSDEAVAGWVLYRLDGGLDHILVDEAQDTSPPQWQVIERLAQEFTSGQGARDGVHRTVFVVGDQKQSIYSFQGADPAEFERMRRHFQSRLDGVGAQLQRLDLEYSFRSSDAILRFVQNVFQGHGGPDLKMHAQHMAFHAALPGRVDLWPTVPETEAPEKRDWHDPVDTRAENHHDVILAGEIADRIAALIGNETIPLQNGTRRPITAGDFLILVRRRSRLFEEIIRACKTRGLPIAGADRLKLGGELAVNDLAALMRFLATPEDDLSLAAALRSPLFGWTEAQIYDLAAGRGAAFLWAVLRRRAEAHRETVDALTDLRDAADFLRPYDLIERVLTRFDGRRRLLARLGAEAEDGIDAMLSQALAYERMEVPSLTGFLTWLETDDVELKRQLDSAGGQIRVMTVHGAKGLEAPIVILPDTAPRTSRQGDEIVTLDRGRAVWRPAADRQTETVRSALDRLKQARAEEELRLFYVAITRAETWLMICAAGKSGKKGESWHEMAEAALTDCGAEVMEMPTGTGLRYAHGDWGAGPVETTAPDAAEAVALPRWARTRAAPPVRPAEVASPSDLGGDKVLAGEGGRDEAAALRFGRLVHLLLEHLPELPPERRSDAAPALLRATEPVEDAEIARALDHAERVLAADTLAPLFAEAALTEVDVTAALAELGLPRIRGTIDRLIVTPERVLAVDFKTNAVVPERAGDTPLGLLRQMAAYQAALEAIYRDRPVETAILWTAVPRLMRLDRAALFAALPGTALP